MTFATGEIKTHSARRVKRDGRTVILPPEGYGSVWVGSQLLGPGELAIRDMKAAAEADQE